MSKEHEYSKESSLAIAVLTISDTRQIENDRGGNTIRRMLEEEGHQMITSTICHDEKEEIEAAIEKWIKNPNIQGIITTGGTGLGFRDISVETIEPYFTKKISGFGELFRMISYTEDVGAKALLSRAEAGIIDDKVIYLLPGSVKAVELAMKKLILPELHHVIYEITKHKNGGESRSSCR